MKDRVICQPTLKSGVKIVQSPEVGLKGACVIADLAKSPIPSTQYGLMFVLEFEEID